MDIQSWQATYTLTTINARVLLLTHPIVLITHPLGCVDAKAQITPKPKITSVETGNR